MLMTQYVTALETIICGFGFDAYVVCVMFLLEPGAESCRDGV